ncbi:signal recognition particle GTPase [Geminocystis sp. NIES-3708]|uniref:GTP-binding protein n=1 Tax=Geminocystis sp. NIES-3708 TaxID=1615909 RepID=UPI0005FC58DE|nr:GTP-binding protein [Geminocystis sp. NIES-3708]BAQ62549.1 signal recognition particle GTPase [Geminocystis sp. NIES-3708]
MITAVLGNFGVGKTHWIKQQIKQNNEDIYYISPQTKTFPVDGAFLQSFFPDLSITDLESPTELLKLSQKNDVYLEIPEYLDVKAILSILSALNCQKIAIVSKDESKEKWQELADKIIVNKEVIMNDNLNSFSDLEIHRAGLTEEVLDFASLETFWQELTQGAYGDIFRAKGIFNIMDGQCVYGEYLHNSYNPEFYPLNIPLSLEGGPTHFSGLEIIGCNLDKQAIADTLGDFCLGDDAVNYYQQQVKETLLLSRE